MRIGKIDKNLQAFKESVTSSFSIAEVARKLGYKESGGIYKFLYSKINKYGLDISHFTGQSWAKGKTRDTHKSINKMAKSHEVPWHEAFKINTTIGNTDLLKRLIRSGKRKNACEVCGIDKWREEPIILQLHHINGVNNDGREENLQILCPNCHSQTYNWSRSKR